MPCLARMHAGNRQSLEVDWKHLVAFSQRLAMAIVDAPAIVRCCPYRPLAPLPLCPLVERAAFNCWRLHMGATTWCCCCMPHTTHGAACCRVGAAALACTAPPDAEAPGARGQVLPLLHATARDTVLEEFPDFGTIHADIFVRFPELNFVEPIRDLRCCCCSCCAACRRSACTLFACTAPAPAAPAYQAPARMAAHRNLHGEWRIVGCVHMPTARTLQISCSSSGCQHPGAGVAAARWPRLTRGAGRLGMLQAGAPGQAGRNGGRGDAAHGRVPAAAEGQVRLRAVRLRAGALPAERRRGRGQAQHLPAVPGQGALCGAAPGRPCAKHHAPVRDVQAGARGAAQHSSFCQAGGPGGWKSTPSLDSKSGRTIGACVI